MIGRHLGGHRLKPLPIEGSVHVEVPISPVGVHLTTTSSSRSGP